jgi:hypothetical protein
VAHRTFTDALGVSWEAWDVLPGRARAGDPVENRVLPDRRARPAHPDDVPAGPPPATGERRSGADRRVAIAPPLRLGWLAFRAGDEQRRLAPIPRDWATAEDALLAAYLAAAEPVATRP